MNSTEPHLLQISHLKTSHLLTSMCQFFISILLVTFAFSAPLASATSSKVPFKDQNLSTAEYEKLKREALASGKPIDPTLLAKLDTPLSPELMNKMYALMQKQSTWDTIPKQATMCMFVPDGAHGDIFKYAKQYLYRLPEFLKISKEVGVHFSISEIDATTMLIRIAQDQPKREAKTELKFRLYTAERVLAEDFQHKKCHIAIMSSMRGRLFHPFVGSLDAIGAVPSQKHMATAIRLLSHPSMARYMVNKNYEVVSIIPAGAAYIMVGDKNINSIAKAAGKKVAVLGFDKSQEKLVMQMGAQPVATDIGDIGRKFNNHQVDIIAGPALMFEPFELYKGMTDTGRRSGKAVGGIINYPITQISLLGLMHRDFFPEGVGQLMREFSAEQIKPAFDFIETSEKAVPKKFWLEVDAAEALSYQKIMRESRIQMTKEGYYHPKMMALLKKIRCKHNPKHYECALSDE